jgi:multiple sugar transport system permease protein
MERDKTSRNLFLAPALAILLLFTAYPLVYSIYLSLHHWDFGAPRETMTWAGLGNFCRAITDPYFWISFKNTAIFLVTSLSIEFVLGFLVASFFLHHRSSPYRGLIRVLRPFILLPMIISPVAVGMMWRLLFNYELGLVNYFLSVFEIPGIAWLTDTRFALGAVIFTDIWEWTPFMFLIFLSGLASVSQAPIESASIDGANRFQILVHIKLPLMQPIILVALLVRGIDIIKMFDLVFVMTMGGPGTTTETLSLYGYRQSFMQSNMGYGSAVSFLLTGIVTVIGLLIIRQMYRELE